MENNDIDHLISLTGEQFFVHIEQKYGKSVGKILRYHDIDDYVNLGKVGKRELIDLFEQPDDENITSELSNLKKEICNIYKDSISLKIGTKNKVILLLKSTQSIIKKKNLQLKSQTQSQRVSIYQSTSSSSNSNFTDSDNEFNLKKCYADVSAKNFNIFIEKKQDNILPVCSIRCICGDKIKLYSKNNRFQVSNFMKHLKKNINKPRILINHSSEDSDDSEIQSQMDLDGQILRSGNIQSDTQNKITKTVHVDTDESDESTPINIKNK
jgi:hypothetical protein